MSHPPKTLLIFPDQIVQLKKENPGTVLMVEVGYKFKFFGDDAKVGSISC